MKTKTPVIHGLMTRRMLINFRVRPEILTTLLPPPFRPKSVNGWGLAGICLVRLEQMRPRFAPTKLGLTSENAAHRIAVEWDENGTTGEGVYVPRRDSDSRINTLVGGRLLPGVQHHANFRTAESDNRFKIEVRSDDGETFVRVAARIAAETPPDSVLINPNKASAFFCNGACGWSPNRVGTGFEGLKLQATNWAMDPLKVERVESSWFDDRSRFPEGSIQFDSAFLMRNIAHEWHVLPPLNHEEKEAA